MASKLLDRFESGVEARLRRAVENVLGADKRPDTTDLLNKVVEDLSLCCNTFAGLRAFPYRYLRLSFDECVRSSYPTLLEVFGNRAVITGAIRRGLEELGCSCPSPLRVDVSFADTTEATYSSHGYAFLGFRELPAPPRIKITIKKGIADHSFYIFRRHTVFVGRDTFVYDRNGTLIRQNDIACRDTFVSRTHARLHFGDEMARFRLFDDFSRAGLTIVRAKKEIAIPTGATGGAWLCPGDEIRLGSTNMLFDLLHPDFQV